MNSIAEPKTENQTVEPQANQAALRRADEPNATIQAAFNQFPDCPDWDMLSNADKAKAFRLPMENDRIIELVQWRNQIEADSDASPETVRAVRNEVHRHIVELFCKSARPDPV